MARRREELSCKRLEQFGTGAEIDAFLLHGHFGNATRQVEDADRAGELVDALPAPNGVIAEAADEALNRAFAGDEVISQASKDFVTFARAKIYEIVAAAGDHEVEALTGMDDVIAGTAVERVVAVAAEQRIVAATAD